MAPAMDSTATVPGPVIAGLVRLVEELLWRFGGRFMEFRVGV